MNPCMLKSWKLSKKKQPQTKKLNNFKKKKKGKLLAAIRKQKM